MKRKRLLSVRTREDPSTPCEPVVGVWARWFLLYSAHAFPVKAF